MFNIHNFFPNLTGRAIKIQNFTFPNKRTEEKQKEKQTKVLNCNRDSLLCFAFPPLFLFDWLESALTTAFQGQSFFFCLLLLLFIVYQVVHYYRLKIKTLIYFASIIFLYILYFHFLRFLIYSILLCLARNTTSIRENRSETWSNFAFEGSISTLMINFPKQKRTIQKIGNFSRNP